MNSFKALGITVETNGTLSDDYGQSPSRNSVKATVDLECPMLPNTSTADWRACGIRLRGAPTDGRAPRGVPRRLAACRWNWICTSGSQASGRKVPGSDSYAAFQFITSADPYFHGTRSHPTQGNVFYLSQDLRGVLVRTAGATKKVQVVGIPTFRHGQRARRIRLHQGSLQCC